VPAESLSAATGYVNAVKSDLAQYIQKDTVAGLNLAWDEKGILQAIVIYTVPAISQQQSVAADVDLWLLRKVIEDKYAAPARAQMSIPVPGQKVVGRDVVVGSMGISKYELTLPPSVKTVPGSLPTA
jgi:hypothetical protein